eukprot:gnl/MRDRNA2_/MRDRNA2_35243_c0_seq1.p1 gnl/MRDRNA2_/MRDRNA2_35243_c0~~gnl/MRDRNA2_/MRDRNA2_35243_c0_seq1.p1  ORF type:complete len:234 (-),score=22.87 gnl/MRDRNA2_/MRDRNA2_35243_c0_seq1:10-711(-)
MLFLLTLATLPCYAAAGLIKVRQTGCEKTYETFSNKLKMCNAETKEMEEQAGEDLDKLQARIDYNDCRIKELNEEWEEVRDDFRTGNPYLRPSLLSVNRSHVVTPTWSQPASHVLESGGPIGGDPLDDEYYYGDQGPVEDPECVCFLDNQCECVPHCRNLFNSCAARYKSTRHNLYQRWKRAKKRIRYQESRIYSLEENIRRTRAADPELDTDGRVEGKYRVSRCGGKPHVVR